MKLTTPENSTFCAQIDQKSLSVKRIGRESRGRLDDGQITKGEPLGSHMVFVSTSLELIKLVRYYLRVRCGSFQNINPDTLKAIRGYTYSRLDQIQLREEE